MIDGGCPIFDYLVQRDEDGTGQIWTEVNPDALYPHSRNDSYVREFVCDMFPATAVAGDPFLFRVIARNTQGTVTSVESAVMYLASVPDKPAQPPTSDASVTSRTQIKVDYQTVPGDGGLPLLSYELQMGTPGTLNDFLEIVGGTAYTLQTYFIVTRNIVQGEDYAFRYRAINAIGTGPWSDIVILKAATYPSQPGLPYYISSTADSITLGLPETIDNGGAKIRRYELFRDDGDLSSAITTQVADYDGVS